MANIKSLQTAEVAALPRNNYRQQEEFDQEDLLALGARIKQDGQLSPIGVAIFPDKSKMLCYGERRLRACIAAELPTIFAIEFPVGNMVEFKAKQAAENLDRSQTDAISDGLLFKQMKDAGTSALLIARKIQLPSNVKKTAEAQVAYVNDRINLSQCHESVHKAFRMGLLKTFTDGTSQARVFHQSPAETQQKVAEQMIANGKQRSDADIARLFTEFQWAKPVNSAIFPKEWFTPDVCAILDGQSICIDEAWWNLKTSTFIVEQREKAVKMCAEIGQEAPFVLMSKNKQESWNEKDEEPMNVYGYVWSEKGKSLHTKVGIVSIKDGWNDARGQAVYFCPISSGCPIHFPDKLAEKEENRATRALAKDKNEKTKLFNESAMEAVLKIGLDAPSIPTPCAEMTRAWLVSLSSTNARNEVAKVMGTTSQNIRFEPTKFKEAFDKLATKLDQDHFDTMVTISNFAQWVMRAEYATHHKNEFKVDFNIDFDSLERIAVNNIKVRKDKAAEANEKDAKWKSSVRECLDNIRFKHEIDCQDDKALLPFFANEEEMKKVVRTLKFSIKGVEDKADRPLVVERFMVRYRELCKLGIYDDDRFPTIEFEKNWMEEDEEEGF